MALSLKSKGVHEKISVPTILNLLKIKKKLEDFLGSKNPTTENFTSNLASNCQIKVNRERLKNPSKSILAKRMEKGYQQWEYCFSRCWKPWNRSSIGTLFWQRFKHWARTCELSSIVWHSNVQEEKGLCHHQELQCEQATLHSDSTLHCKRERSDEASCPCQIYFEQSQRTCPSLGSFYVCWELQSSFILLSDFIIVL